MTLFFFFIFKYYFFLSLGQYSYTVMLLIIVSHMAYQHMLMSIFRPTSKLTMFGCIFIFIGDYTSFTLFHISVGVLDDKYLKGVHSVIAYMYDI